MGKRMLRDRNLEEKIKIFSAGTGAFDGDPASHKAIQIMEEIGIDLTGHSARRVTREMIEEADLVLTMEADHKKWLLGMEPSRSEHIFTLGEYTTNDDVPKDKLHELNIRDPYFYPVETYRESAAQIEKHLEKAMIKILDEMKEK